MPAELRPALPPELVATLALAAAREALGESGRSDYAAIAHAVLEAGVYSAGLAELAGFAIEPPADPAALFTEALRELGVPMPDLETATDRMLHHYVTELAERRRDAMAVMAEVSDLIDYCGCYYTLTDESPDPHGVGELLRVYYRWAYSDEGVWFGPWSPVRRLVRLARRWLAAQ